jgi:hypothetical protein
MFKSSVLRVLLPLATALLSLSACSHSGQNARRVKEELIVARSAHQATVNDRVRPTCNLVYEAVWTAVRHDPENAAPLTRQFATRHPDCTSEVVRGALVGVNVADDRDVASIVENAAYAQLPSVTRYLTIIDTAFSAAPYQGEAIRAGMEAAQTTVVDLQTGKPPKRPLVAFREKQDLPLPARAATQYELTLNREGKGLVYGYAK